MILRKLLISYFLIFFSEIGAQSIETSPVDSNQIEVLDLLNSLHQLDENASETEIQQLHYDIGLIQLNYTLDFDKALVHFKEALNYAKRNSDTTNIINIYQHLGYIQYTLGNKNNAIEYYSNALGLAHSINDDKTSLEITLYIGSLYEEDGLFEDAKKYYQMVLDNYDFSNPSPKSLSAIARLYNLNGDYKKAVEYYIQALELFNDKKDLRWVSYIYSELSLLSVKLNNIDNAIEFGLNGLFIAKQFHLKKEQADNLLAMTRAYERKQDYKNAFSLFQQYTQLKDSIFTEKKLHNVEILQSQLSNEQKEQEIHFLKTEKKLQSAEIKTKKITIYAIIFGGVLVLIFVFILLNRIRIINKQKLEIELKSKKLKNLYTQQSNLLIEKDTLLKEVHHRVKNNMQVINSLLILQSNTIENKQVKEMFKVGQNRIYSMAMVHEMLYSKGNLSHIEFSKYVEELIDKLSTTYTENTSIDYYISIPKTEFDIDTAVPLGLLINEIITNSLKYAFPDNSAGTISIELEEKNNIYILFIGDDGIGLKDNELGQSGGLGHELIESLVDQINGTLEMLSKKGTNYSITFKKKSPLK